MNWNGLELPDNPYYSDDAVIIYQADCRDILPLIPDKSIDLVLTDPPYNAQDIGFNRNSYLNQTMKMPSKEYKTFCNDWFNLVQSTTELLAITCGISNLWNYPPAKWVICWDKTNSLSRNIYGGINAWEPVLIYGNPHNRLIKDIKKTSVFSNGLASQHPCPKPTAFWDWLIMLLTKDNELILDPFLGSGTTAYCAKKLGRKCIGIEIEEKYCEIAAKRCSQTVMRLEA